MGNAHSRRTGILPRPLALRWCDLSTRDFESETKRPMLKIYNTATHRKEEFVPRTPGKVAMYACGPTVYNHIHIGNARTFLTFDVVRRYLAHSGYEVAFVQNITDVDDKIIARAAEEGRSTAEVAGDYTTRFIDAMHRFGILDPDVRPQATKEIGPMIALVKKLVAGGHAYEADGDVYFSVRSFPAYGQLSGRDIDELQSGARVEIDERKRDPLDFALWKAAKPGEPSWPSPWGQGRPGWHLECSAMSEKYLGLPIDIHGGGADLVFPHHENEKAQTEAATGQQFVKYWLHGGMLRINSEKMSKSLGNFLLLVDVLDACDPMALRLLMLQTHYRSPLDFSDARLAEAGKSYERISGAVRNLRWAAEHAGEADDADGANGAAGADDTGATGTAGTASANGSGTGAADDADAAGQDAQARALYRAVQDADAAFHAAMDDDFNTAGALGALFTLVGEGNTFIESHPQLSDDARRAVRAAADAIEGLLGVLGIALPADQAVWPAETCELAAKLAGYAGDDAHEAADALLDAREKARAQKDWGAADAIRDGLSALGFTIEDTANGARVNYGA